ncbi:MAG: 4-alpha-glucanotransferase, partial [Chitinophagaceae bacterium]
AGKKFAHIADNYFAELKRLNELPEVEYPEVNKVKGNFFKEIFPLQKKQNFASKSYQDFFNTNKYWLESYAAFCFLRDKYKTADFYAWPAFKKYTYAAIKKILKANEAEISIHYFLQFHLHTQLLDAVNYLKKKGISLKADLPIGIKRESADHWQFQKLFNENLQAGAPPDAFTSNGQNWGFPTYNWAAIKADNYQWWEAKLNHGSTYAAAIRLDHVLGFFRIWSIPKENVQGILGYFVPTIALNENDFIQQHIPFNEERFCKPFITEQLLQEIFSSEMEYVKDFFLTENKHHQFEFKEAFDTQKKLQHFILKRDDTAQSKKLLERLLYLHTEIILLKDRENGFHFRVNMQHTFSFHSLDENSKYNLNELYQDYFFSRQNELWKSKGNEILSALHKTSSMLYCGEDLGWAPGFVPGVLKDNGILSLEVQRMPKKSNETFTDLSTVPYLSVATPGTHDMQVLRAWWKQDEKTTQLFYNDILRMTGKAPAEADGKIIKKIIEQFLQSPSMWCIFQWQDMIAIDEKLRAADPAKERINDPANSENKWNYRMHISLEEMLKQNEFNEYWKRLITENKRN